MHKISLIFFLSSMLEQTTMNPLLVFTIIHWVPFLFVCLSLFHQWKLDDTTKFSMDLKLKFRSNS